MKQRQGGPIRGGHVTPAMCAEPHVYLLSIIRDVVAARRNSGTARRLTLEEIRCLEDERTTHTKG